MNKFWEYLSTHLSSSMLHLHEYLALDLTPDIYRAPLNPLSHNNKYNARRDLQVEGDF